MTASIGVMQGRLSPLIDGRIQAFPWDYWRDEFPLARSLGLSCIEWTLDMARIFENPLMTTPGRAMINQLVAENQVTIPSLTGDFCMQAPFWKEAGGAQSELVAVFEQVLLSCAAAGIHMIVVPLVDNGALNDAAERAVLERELLRLTPLLSEHRLTIAFESDFAPTDLASFIDGFPPDQFGINFDMGNSASLGWDPDEEIGLLGHRLINVHVKDRVRGGTTVPLGQGAADLPRLFALLRAARYEGQYILQTARAADGAHVEAIRHYSQFVAGQLGLTHGA
jgi:hexulose-6-phosphate isomerase